MRAVEAFTAPAPTHVTGPERFQAPAESRPAGRSTPHPRPGTDTVPRRIIERRIATLRARVARLAQLASLRTYMQRLGAIRSVKTPRVPAPEAVRSLARLVEDLSRAMGARLTMQRADDAMTQGSEIERARRRRGPAVQAHADTHGLAPSTEESRAAESYLNGGSNAAGTRPGLADVIDELTRKRLDGSAPARSDAFGREFDIYWRLMPHTRERPREENQWQLDRENRGPVRSDRAGAHRRADDQRGPRPVPGRAVRPDGHRHAAGAATRRALRRLDRHRGGSRNAGGSSRRPSSAGGQPSLLACYAGSGTAIVPLEVQFRRDLAQRREVENRAAENGRQQVSAVQTRAPSKPRGRDWWD